MVELAPFPGALETGDPMAVGVCRQHTQPFGIASSGGVTVERSMTEQIGSAAFSEPAMTRTTARLRIPTDWLRRVVRTGTEYLDLPMTLDDAKCGVSSRN